MLSLTSFQLNFLSWRNWWGRVINSLPRRGTRKLITLILTAKKWICIQKYNNIMLVNPALFFHFLKINAPLLSLTLMRLKTRKVQKFGFSEKWKLMRSPWNPGIKMAVNIVSGYVDLKDQVRPPELIITRYYETKTTAYFNSIWAYHFPTGYRWCISCSKAVLFFHTTPVALGIDRINDFEGLN